MIETSLDSSHHEFATSFTHYPIAGIVKRLAFETRLLTVLKHSLLQYNTLTLNTCSTPMSNYPGFAQETYSATLLYFLINLSLNVGSISYYTRTIISSRVTVIYLLPHLLTIPIRGQ